MSVHLEYIYLHHVVLIMQMKIIIENQVGVTTVTAMTGGSEDEKNLFTLIQVPATPYITGNISTVADPDVYPTMTTSAFVEVQKWTIRDSGENFNLMVDHILQDEGYDYNLELGSSHNASGRGELLNNDEEEVVPIVAPYN